MSGRKLELNSNPSLAAWAGHLTYLKPISLSYDGDDDNSIAWL